MAILLIKIVVPVKEFRLHDDSAIIHLEWQRTESVLSIPLFAFYGTESVSFLGHVLRALSNLVRM